MHPILLRLIGLTLYILSAATVNAQIQPTFRDIDYVGDGLQNHLLDVYVPPDVNSPRPAVVYIHGGGWKNQSKKGTLRDDLRQLYEDAQYIIVDINHRYSTEAIWPAQIYDCKTAIRHIRYHADLYQIDPCAIGVIGHSSGGHLAAMLGTAIGIDSLEGYHLGYPDERSDVQAVVDFFGPTDFLQADGLYPNVCESPVIYEEPGSMVSQLVGCFITECADKVQAANPITYVDGNEPPFSIYHGIYDCTVPALHSALLYSALIENNIPTQTDFAQSAGHADPLFYTTAVITELTNFFVEHLSLEVCEEVPSCEIASDHISVELYAYMEGPFDPVIGQMTTNLNTIRGLLPGQAPKNPIIDPTLAGQPYNMPPWNYTGTEGFDWTDDDYNGTEVDWVLVSFRTEAAKSTEVVQTAALIHQDGSITFPNPCFLTEMMGTAFYIVVEHRNHLGIMSSIAVNVLDHRLFYDFRVSDSYIVGLGFGQKQFPTGEWSMYAADVEQLDMPSALINGLDKNLWTQENGNFGGYCLPDFNLDGDVNGQDKSLWFDNHGIYSRVPK